MPNLVKIIAKVADIVFDSSEIKLPEEKDGEALTRKQWGILLLFIAFCLLAGAISSTVKYYTSVEDYHSITSKNVRYGNVVNGTVDECYGPFAGYDDGRELYLLEVDNGQFITYITDDEQENEQLEAYGKNSEEAVKIDISGKIEGISEEIKSASLETLVGQGLNIQQAEEKLILYTIVNYTDGTTIFEYSLGLALAPIGIILFLPEYSDFLDRTGKKRNRNAPANYSTTSYYPYHNQQATQQRQYTTYTGSQYNPKYTAQGQSRNRD